MSDRAIAETILGIAEVFAIAAFLIGCDGGEEKGAIALPSVNCSQSNAKPWVFHHSQGFDLVKPISAIAWLVPAS